MIRRYLLMGLIFVPSLYLFFVSYTDPTYTPDMLWLRVSFGVLAGTSLAGFFYRPFVIMTSVAAVGLSLVFAAVMGFVLYAGGGPTGNGSFEVDRWWSLSVIIILLAFTALAISVIRK